MDDTSLIFLISQPRAGSTMLQNLLARHPAIHTTPEPWILLPLLSTLQPKSTQAKYNAALAHEALLDFCNTLDGGLSNYDEAIRRMVFSLYGVACQQAGKPIFLDKTPRYYHILPEMLRIFPHAKFILLYRNPLAVLNSLLETHIKGHWILLARYKHDLFSAPKKMIMAASQSAVPVYTLQYENLVREPQEQLKALTDFLGLDFSPDMLTYQPDQAASGIMGDATGVQKYDRPSTTRINNWLDMAHNVQTRYFAQAYLEALGPELISVMGYDADELRCKIDSILCGRGEVEVTWQQLFEPDEVLQKRLWLIELALLEHQRLVHAWQKLKNHIFSR
jgi:hypothetical protein